MFFAFGCGITFAQDPFVDSILGAKSVRRMTLKSKRESVKQYKISLGGQPEGNYIIESHNSHSAYHLSWRLSYPNPEQRRCAKTGGYSAGGDIMVHGYLNWAVNQLFDIVPRNFDWTEECMAITHSEIEEIYRLVKDGASIEIRP